MWTRTGLDDSHTQLAHFGCHGYLLTFPYCFERWDEHTFILPQGRVPEDQFLMQAWSQVGWKPVSNWCFHGILGVAQSQAPKPWVETKDGRPFTAISYAGGSLGTTATQQQLLSQVRMVRPPKLLKHLKHFLCDLRKCCFLFSSSGDMHVSTRISFAAAEWNYSSSDFFLGRCMCSTVPWGGWNSWNPWQIWLPPAWRDPQEPEEFQGEWFFKSWSEWCIVEPSEWSSQSCVCGIRIYRTPWRSTCP